ncbi:hypothetical protein NDI51_03545 [Microcoleus vaginatus GB1-A3]
MYETFIDLDELIVRCRDKLAKKLIQEAVACYRAGAYRSCIVATWNAIVFDFLHKLRELELLDNNGEATIILKNFEIIRSESKFKELWQFESDIPDIALTKFELLSSVEKSDIQRLFEDRSRCAHPSMTSLEEPFEATAELARYHLRSAVMHCLQRQPVQGSSALKRIWQDIGSEYFPTDSEKATQYFQKGLLASARPSLIKNVIIGLTKNLLTEERSEDERLRQFSALNAVANMYHSQVKEILNEHLSKIILDKVTDSNWDKVIIYLGTVEIWDNLSEPCQLKAIAFMEKLEIFDRSLTYNPIWPKNVNVLLKATRVAFLKEIVNSKFQLSLEEIVSLKKFCQNELKYNPINEIIKPLLEERIPQANLDELFSMYSDKDSLFNEKIKPYIEDKIKDYSLVPLIFSLEINLEVKKFLDDFIKEILQAKINEACLDDLLEARKQINDLSFIDSIKRFEDVIQVALRDNVPHIVDRFKQSSSYREAETNACLLAEVSDYLSPTQWETILEGFCDNNKIYDSLGCPSTFSDLFKKSVKIHGDVQPYWLSFREKLDQFNILELDNLKDLIDYYV